MAVHPCTARETRMSVWGAVMSLFRQTMIMTMGMILVLFAALYVITIQGSSRYLREQLQVHAQDTATSLAMSISSLDADDVIGLESLSRAMFDSGHFQTVHVASVDDRTLLQLSSPVFINDVPGWFINIVPLPSPAGQAEIMSGWSRRGTLTVTAHPGYTYQDLWRMTQDYLLMFTLVAILSYLIVGLGLRISMRPLL